MVKRPPAGFQTVAALLATLCTPLTPAPILAQQPAPVATVELTGVVVDATTASPVTAALVSVEGGSFAITDAEGRFRLRDVAVGPQRVVVRALGYVEFTSAVTVVEGMPPIDLRIQPDPLRLEGIDVSAGGRAGLVGVVLDAQTDERVGWASLWLTRDLNRRVAREYADADGIFQLSSVPVGPYLLGIELLGYESQYVQVMVWEGSAPVEVRLEPDAVVKAGLVKLDRDLASRRNAMGTLSRAFDFKQLRYSAAPGVLHFLRFETSLGIADCPPNSRDRYCIGVRGRLIAPRVFLDELPVWDGLSLLGSYEPGDFYSIEVVGSCVYAYTVEFAEKRARRPRAFLPACL